MIKETHKLLQSMNYFILLVVKIMSLAAIATRENKLSMFTRNITSSFIDMDKYPLFLNTVRRNDVYCIIYRKLLF